MNKKLYNLMDWSAIEEVVYGECDHPKDYLGPHTIGKQTLVLAFFPEAAAVTLYIDGVEGARGKTVREEIKMELADDAGFYAALLPGKDRKDYQYHVVYKNKTSKTVKDAYAFQCSLTEEQRNAHMSGTAMDVYQFMGCHRKTVNGVRGCIFRVWAPNAIRCSIVGDFNNWNSLEHQMNRSVEGGIFELFIPGIEDGAKYKYDILARGAITFQKADPFSVAQELRPNDASIVASIQHFSWKDDTWMKNRKKTDWSERPMNIYEFSLSAYQINGNYCNIRSIATEVANYVKSMGYTHIALMPIMEYPEDAGVGYHTSLYYAPSSRFGDAQDYMYFINEMHQCGLGVILQWMPSAFSNYAYGLGSFDGTCLYEHEDCRKGIDPRNGMLMFNYKRPEVAQYLLANLFYWMNEYHVDGFLFNDVASILYLDYYRKPGEWIPNLYGGNENLDSIEFIKEANEFIHKHNSGVLTIADEESGWPNTTGNKEEDLGFDLCYNHGFNHDVVCYMQHDPIERHAHHHELTLSTVYQYSENYILPISHHNVNFNQGGLLAKMPGTEDEKFSNAKAMIGYLMFHPGKKLLFMGQENGSRIDLDGTNAILPDALEVPGARFLHEFCKALNLFYLSHPACYVCDYDNTGFEWINSIAANENVIVFKRKSKEEKDSLTIVLNFANRSYEKYAIGVAQDGRYKEIFSSDQEKYGGKGNINSRAIPAKEEAYDGRNYSIRLNLAPLSLSVLEWIPYTEQELKEIQEKKALREQKHKESMALKEQKRLQTQLKKKQLAEEKAKIRASLKEELARKIADAEAQIAQSGNISIGSKATKGPKKSTSSKATAGNKNTTVSKKEGSKKK